MSAKKSTNTPRTPDRSYQKGIGRVTDKHLCQFLLSPLQHLGLRYYKTSSYPAIKFAEGPKQVSNRLVYLKKIKTTNPQSFVRVCKSHSLNWNQQPRTLTRSKEDHSYAIETDKEEESEEHVEEEVKEEIIVVKKKEPK